MRPWARGLTRNILLLGVASLLTDVSSEIIIPILPLFLQGLGASLFVIGLIDSVADSTATFVKMVSGHASDRTGRRKRFVAAGYGFSTLSKVALPFATWPLHVFGVRIGDRIGKGVRDPPRDALIAESTGPETLGKAFGFHRTMDTTGAILGPILVIALLPSLAASGDTGQAYRGLFLLAVVPAFAAWLVILTVREMRGRPKPNLRLRVSLRALPVRLRLFVGVAGLYSLANFTLAIPIVIVYKQAGNAGFSDVTAASLATLDYLLFNIVYALLAVRAGSLSDRIGRKPVILVGYSAFIVGSLGFALFGSPFLLLLSFLAYGVAYGFVEGTQRALVADLAPGDLKATSMGTYHAAVGLGKLPASILAGALATFVSASAAFLTAAAIASMAAALFVGTFSETRV
ncbi:MAG TPA: MFS transporter [Thermoplasmata archaeon]|nr:MFS transporter [Thermoplasmata archaeon]